MSAEENKAIFRRYVEEVTNKGNFDVADEIFDRYVAHQSDGSTLERGPEDVKQFMSEFRQGFPDIRSVVEDQVAEGDKVVESWDNMDQLGMMQQLGVIPSPEEAQA